MNWIKNIFKDFTEESEEGKQNRLAREKTIAEQNDYLNNMKCPICGHNEFNRSSLIAQSGVDLSFIKKLRSYYKSDDETFYNKIYKVNSTMCLHCGYIINFADMSTVNIEKI